MYKNPQQFKLSDSRAAVFSKPEPSITAAVPLLPLILLREMQLLKYRTIIYAGWLERRKISKCARRAVHHVDSIHSTARKSTFCLSLRTFTLSLL